MALVSYRWRRILRTSISTILGCGAIGAIGTMGLSALLNWDPSGDPLTPGGTGTWDYPSLFWDDNGALPNLPWTDATGVDTGVFKGTGDLVHLGAPITANGLRFNVTGYTIDNNGTAANTLNIVTATVGGPKPLITSNAASITSTISASILGNDGLEFTAGALTGTTTKLTGDNKFIGGVTITSGTVELGNAGALNQSFRNSLTLGPTVAAALRLNGNSVTIRDLTGAAANSTITNGVAGNAILTVYQLADKSVKTVLADGAAGTLELVKAGPALITLGSDNTYTGATTARGGTLELAGNNVGRLTATSGITISSGGTLRLTNSSVANNGDRVPAVAINMRGGTFAFSNNASAAPVAETAGALFIQYGTNNIFADQAASGQTSTLTFASLNRTLLGQPIQGAIVLFQSNFDGTLAPRQIGGGVVAADINRDRIVFTAAPALNDGLIGGWAIYDTDEFATYNATTATSVKQAATTLNPVESTWVTSTNAKYDASGSITLTDVFANQQRVVNSLNLATDPVNLDLSGLTLTIDTGGLISQSSGPFGGSIDNGNLTAGTAAGADLHIRTTNALGTLTVTATIVNNGVGQVNATGLVKSGPGTLALTTQNFYTGPTAIVGGTILIDADSRLGATPASATAGALKLYDGTLSVSSTFTLNANRSIEVGGNSVISVAAGTTANGKTLTYNGSISSIPGTEGNLTILSNASELSDGADPGKINFQLNAQLALTGSLRIDAATIFRPSAVFANSIGRSLQIGTNGTATFTQTGNTLTVGNGVDDTLDIGLKDAATFSSVAKVGTLTLTGVTQFTAKVDKVRIGVQTQTGETVNNNVNGTVTLATNNDISAGTGITISDNANAAGITLTASTLTFGAGTNNVTSQSILLGGRRGTATLTVPASGTLNLKGFGERTLNLSIGRSDASDTIIPSTGTFTATATNAVVTGSFDNLVVGSKAGSATGGRADGTFSLGAAAGNSIVANSVQLGVHTGMTAAASSTTTATGTLNMAGGTFTVYNDVVLGTQANNGLSTGNLNLTGGTFNVGGNITKTNAPNSRGVINLSGATLNMRNPLVGDTSSGTITASQLNFSAGSITNTAAINLDGRDLGSGVAVPFVDALTLRDFNLAAPVNLTGTSANNGGIHYLNAGNGAGATLASVSLGGVARTFNVENSTVANDLTITGAVTGAVPIMKTGTGTVLLNGAVDGSATIVGGALGGSGTIAGSVSVGALGTLTPAGASNIGTLTTGELITAATSTLALNINFVNRTSDRVNVNGNLTLDLSATPTVLTLNDLNPIGTFSFFTLTIVDYSGAWNGGLFSVGGVPIDDYDPVNNPNSSSFFVGPNRYRIDYNFNSGDRAVLVSVPEPGSLALVAGGVALLGLRRRRR